MSILKTFQKFKNGINENKVGKFEWTYMTKTIKLVNKILESLNIKYRTIYTQDINVLDRVSDKRLIHKIGFRMNSYSYYIEIEPEIIYDENFKLFWDGINGDIRVSIHSSGTSNNILPRYGNPLTLKNGEELYKILSEINGSMDRWIKNINGLL